MRTLKITATFAYDEEMMGDREEERAWFYNLLITEKLRVLSDEIGDEIGQLEITEIACPYDKIAYHRIPGYIAGYGCPACKSVVSYHLPIREKHEN